MTVSAHPGRTDSNGGHYCRTNCAKWGLANGEYHYHNGGSTSSDSSTSSDHSSGNTYTAPAVQPTVPQYQVSSLKVYVNGTRVQFASDPVLYKDSNLVPLREIAEALGAKLTFNADAGAIGVSKDKYKMTLTIGSKTIYYNGKKTTIDIAPVVIEGVTYVPAQVFARGLGASIAYNASTETLKVTTK